MNTLNRIATVASLAVLVLASSVSAQMDTEHRAASTTTHASTTRADMKAQMQEKRVEAKTRMEERRKNLIKEYTARTVKRFHAALERLDNIANRIGSRLDKLATQGASVANARLKLELARTKIAEAKTATDAIMTAVDAALASDTPKSQFEKVRMAIENAHKKIKAAHAALIDVVNSIKPGTIRATSTPTSAGTGTP